MDDVRFDDRGLAPCVIQDWRTGEVLTLAYTNAEALARTRETGELHLWSRSRDELWHKGATSGNVQRVRALRVDCDNDAVLALDEALALSDVVISAVPGGKFKVPTAKLRDGVVCVDIAGEKNFEPDVTAKVRFLLGSRAG